MSTDQTQPTEALTDAELIDVIEMDTGLSAGTIRDVLAVLPQAGYRLARAESAPGVTISPKTARACRWWAGPAERSDAWYEPDDRAALAELDAALADTGTEAGK